LSLVSVDGVVCVVVVGPGVGAGEVDPLQIF
jgi:hypothetical protein